MLLTRQKRKPTRPTLNMAAMVDIVFLLLIFFMCTTSFKKPERHLPSQLPETGISLRPEQEEFDPIRIRLSMLSDELHLTCDAQVCENFAELRRQLAARRAITDAPVIIEGVAEVPFGHMVSALDSCYQANLRRVAFSAKGMAP